MIEHEIKFVRLVLMVMVYFIFEFRHKLCRNSTMCAGSSGGTVEEDLRDGLVDQLNSGRLESNTKEWEVETRPPRPHGLTTSRWNRCFGLLVA